MPIVGFVLVFPVKGESDLLGSPLLVVKSVVDIVHVEDHADWEDVRDQVVKEKDQGSRAWVVLNEVGELNYVQADYEVEGESEDEGEAKDTHDDLQTLHLLLHGTRAFLVSQVILLL